MTRLILFLIRRKLHLKKGERFQFANQKSEVNRYYFTGERLMKEGYDKYKGWSYFCRPSNVKFNYLMGNQCKIVKCEKLSWC